MLRDKLWFRGSWGQNDIEQTAAGGGDDDTILENTAFKVNAQFSAANSAHASWNNGAVSPDSTAAGLDPPLTDELILGVEHALMPEFVVGLNYTLSDRAGRRWSPGRGRARRRGRT